MRTALFVLFALVMACALPVRAQNVQWTADANTTSCDCILNTGTVVSVPASAGKCLHPVSTAPVGANTSKCTAIRTDPIWGNATATQATFNFTRPGPPAALTAPTLTP